VELHKLEQIVLLALKDARRLSISEICGRTGLNEAAIMRAALWLSLKKLAKIEEEKWTFLQLGPEGRKFLREGLPERRLVSSILDLNGRATFDQVVRASGLGKQEATIAIGWAKRKNWITVRKEKDTLILEATREPEFGPDEKLIDTLTEGRLPVEKLSPEQLAGLDALKRRPGVLTISDETKRYIVLTEEGAKEAHQIVEVVKEVSLLTQDLIRTGRWRDVKLRRFDVTAPGPTIYPGKIHPIRQIIQEVRESFLEMGFTEIRGPLVETAFWNFDALYQPQDHPAREMQDTFYISYPKLGDLPTEEVTQAVGKVHENGWITGSTGWGYKWSPDEARKLILRTHTTATTIRYLAEHKEPPVKVFSVDRVYRNEKVDYKHLAEFHQIEGIIMDKNVTLRDLMGTLSEFYRKLGMEKVQFWPSYFPYTEPSVQTTVYVPELGRWIELCGMGIFRPEVVRPLGIKHPVLAWGGGLERIIMIKLGVDDVRYLYKNDLGWIRRMPIRR
jgi:phenylalanyl-tRNA synthetase alpha chain